MTTYYDMKNDLERLGLDCRPGCRVDLVEEAFEQWGMPTSDIIAAMSDREVIEAVHYAMSVNGVFAFHEEEEEELEA